LGLRIFRTGVQTLGLILGLALPLAATPTLARPVDSGHVQAELITSGEAVPGGELVVALRQTVAKDWHTYWRNPGDAGQATTLDWRLPQGWKAGGIVWATPQRLPLGTLMNYGYEGEVVLPVTLVVPVDAKPGQILTLAAEAGFLVCKDICIPEQASLTLEVKVASGTPKVDAKAAKTIAAALTAAPKPAGLKAAMTMAGGVLKLSVTGAPLSGGNFAKAYFYPFDSTVLDHAKPQAIERGQEGLTLTLPVGYAFTQTPVPTSLSGVLDIGGAAFEITATTGPALAGAAGLGAPVAGLDAPQGGMSLPLAILFAFLGGLILNLMPCVFPILSMKAAALTAHGGEHDDAKGQGLAFLAGVVSTFLALAGALIVAKAAGAAVGWGFQLQSPVVVAVLCLVMLLTALNLSGLFEVGASLQGAAGSSRLAARSGLVGAFFTGVLAVVVAAPCTAPFMAGAIGFALTQGPAAALLIFTFLGLGLAAPFTALAFSPGLTRRLPRPGPWMERLKQALAFPLYGTAAWLAWVFVIQAGTQALAFLFAAAVAVAFAGWLYGLAQRASLSGGKPRLSLALAAFSLIGAVALIVAGSRLPAPSTSAATPVASGSEELPSEPFSPARLAALRTEGRPVLVNFTAAWCITCQVNDRAALSRPAVAQALKAAHGVYMVGDWTNRDGVIAKALAEQGRAGVPLYLVYGVGGRDAVVLPQLLTEGAVVAALETAAKP
jgi:thiol:disulfide interchange protein DsbD